MVHVRPRQQKVHVVRAGTRGVVEIGALQFDVRIAHSVDALVAPRGAGQLPLQPCADPCHVENPRRVEHSAEHVAGRARVIPGDGRPGGVVDAGRVSQAPYRPAGRRAAPRVRREPQTTAAPARLAAGSSRCTASTIMSLCSGYSQASAVTGCSMPRHMASSKVRDGPEPLPG